MRRNRLKIDEKDREKIERAGINVEGEGRGGSFMMSDSDVSHVSINQEGVEMLRISEALEKYEWAENYMWKLIDRKKDKYTKSADKNIQSGYFIRVKKGVKSFMPFQACFFLKKKKFTQKVHNLIILEEGSSLDIINGCAAASYAEDGAHIGVTEIFIGKNASLSYTMIHDWAKQVEVRPRSAVRVEEGGSYISNYIALRDTKMTQMYPKAVLAGKNAAAKFNSLVMAPEGSVYDLGAGVTLAAEGTKAEIISRSISKGGDIIARGHLKGESPGVTAHLECDGLMLSDKGRISAIPELETSFSDADMSHEAAIGKVDKEQILYLMSRGIPEKEAISAIVSGFMDVKIFGLPPALENEIKKSMEELEKGGM